MVDYGFFAAAVAEGDGDGFAIFGGLSGPTFTILASSEPSEFLQYEPDTSSSGSMSFMVALCTPLLTIVRLLTLRVCDFCLPEIVNVFAD